MNLAVFGASLAPELISGKFMRHVKLRPERNVNVSALMKLIETAYTDMKGRLKAE